MVFCKTLVVTSGYLIWLSRTSPAIFLWPPASAGHFCPENCFFEMFEIFVLTCSWKGAPNDVTWGCIIKIRSGLVYLLQLCWGVYLVLICLSRGKHWEVLYLVSTGHNKSDAFWHRCCSRKHLIWRFFWQSGESLSLPSAQNHLIKLSVHSFTCTKRKCLRRRWPVMKEFSCISGSPNLHIRP